MLVFTDYNDINEDTRMQIELINQSLAELHTDKKITSKPRNRIGFISEDYFFYFNNYFILHCECKILFIHLHLTILPS